MDLSKTRRLLLQLMIGYWVFVLLVWILAGSQFREKTVITDSYSSVGNTEELTDGMQVTQSLRVSAAKLDKIEVILNTFSRSNTGRLLAVFTNQAGQVIAEGSLDLSQAQNQSYSAIPFEQHLPVDQGETLLVTFTTENCSAGNAVALCYGNTVSTARADIEVQFDESELYHVNGKVGIGMLCLRITGTEQLSFYKTYWIIVAALFLLISAYCIHSLKQAEKGAKNGIALLSILQCRYGFLLHQLVSRNFKAKYKRSVLGVAWSFLNPLFHMLVQYFVFSTLFKHSTANYPVYLLTGTVLFNYFSEAVSSGMGSITNNAALLKKVYVPKYIYPLSGLLSSTIELLLMLIPLILVVIITGTPLRPSLLLLSYDILCLCIFTLGMIFLFSTAMTFFQDTKFLWNVIRMIWMYLTPLFYTDNIIPTKFLFIYRMNPMYQYITFARTCIIDGISPQPEAYLWCLVLAVVPLAIGAAVFHRYQDKFILHL